MIGKGKREVDWPTAVAAGIITVALFIWRNC